MLGLFVTVYRGVLDSFVACGGEKFTCMAAMVEMLSTALWPIGIGLAAGIIALWCYRYLSAQLKALDCDMENGTLELLNQLTRYRGEWTCSTATPNDPLPAARSRRMMPLIIGALLVAFGIEIEHYAAAWPAFAYVLFTFGLACLPANFLALRMHRLRGATAPMAAVACLCWCAAERLLALFLPVTVSAAR